MKRGILVFIFLFLAVSLGRADYIENLSQDAYVDWTNGLMRAKGVGYPSEFSEGSSAQKKLEARQAAKTDAIRKLAEAINNIRIDGVTLVKDFQAENEVVRSHIQAFVKNCAEKEVTYLPDGRCEVIVEASLTGEGSLSHIIYDNLKVIDISGVSNEEKPLREDIGEEQGKIVEASLEEEKEEDIEELEQQEPLPEEEAQVAEEIVPQEQEVVAESTQEKQPGKKLLPSFVSGLIVDAKKTSAKPAINPAIISDTGEELYNISVPDRVFRTRQGLASYTAKVESAEINSRVTKTPYVIEALRIVQENPCIIMVSQKEFEEFKRLRGSDVVLERAKVIIVVGK